MTAEEEEVKEVEEEVKDAVEKNEEVKDVADKVEDVVEKVEDAEDIVEEVVEKLIPMLLLLLVSYRSCIYHLRYRSIKLGWILGVSCYH